MAAFRGTVQGNRGEASRLGSRSSGIVARINSWMYSVTSTITADDEDHEAIGVRIEGSVLNTIVDLRVNEKDRTITVRTPDHTWRIVDG